MAGVITGYSKVDGATVALDHNYAQICPIRAMKIQKEPHPTIFSAINSQPRRTIRNKHFISNNVTEQSETLEEDDLVEYYSQWCDKMFSSDGKETFKPQEVEVSRASTSFSFDYDSFDSTNGDSNNSGSQRPCSVTLPESTNNLNLLANCGVENNSKDASSVFESNPSESPHSSKDSSGDYEECKTEKDHQVLAAANALLQLSGTDNSVDNNPLYVTSDITRKRKHPAFDDQEQNDDWLDHHISQATFPLNTLPGSSQHDKLHDVKEGQIFSTRAKQIKTNYLYGLQNKEKDAKRKVKKKRKYKKAAGKNQGTLEDDDSLDDDLGLSCITFVPCSKLAASHNPWGQAMPTNVLLKIFQYAVDSSGAFPFLNRASKVCRLWYVVTADDLLWRSVDLSMDFIKKLKKHFIWLCKNRLSQTRFLNLANWETLTGKEIQVLAKHCNKLNSISLSRCSKLNSSALRGLIESCTELREVDLSYTSTVVTSRYMLEYLLEARGRQLTSLNLATNILVKFDIVMQSIAEKCVMLEVLDLSNVVFSNCLLPIHVERLQMGCPRLRTLLLTNSLFKVKRASIDEEEASLDGFCHLETLSVARSPVSRISKFRYVNDEVLYRMLKSSNKLRTLDISGCRHVTCAGLQSLPVPSITALNLSHCPLVNNQHVQHNLDKWKHSLNRLDLGGNSLSADFLRTVLDKCKSLESLTLTGCRGLPWHVRREYQQDTLPDLRRALQSSDEHPDIGS